MKRLFYLAFLCAFALVSCDNSKDYYVENEDDTSKFVMTEGYTVPVEEGKITVVTVDGFKVYEGNMSIEIQVPKQNTKTRGNITEVEYLPASELEQKNHWFYYYKHGVLMFEDVKNGDNDYNDFICHISEKFYVKTDNVETSGTYGIHNLKLEELIVTPIAMGNTLPMGLGFDIICDGKQHKDTNVLTTDVRKEYFNGVAGFLNTEANGVVIDASKKEYKNFNQANGNVQIEESFGTNYYIIVNGEKLYACDSSKATLTDNGTPFGLFIPLKDNVQYPLEKASIYDVYPNFGDWVDGKSNDPFANPQAEYIYTRN